MSLAEPMTPHTDDMEKLVKTLPPIRVDEPMFNELAQRAAMSDRKLSDYVRHALRMYLQHVQMVEPQEGESK